MSHSLNRSAGIACWLLALILALGVTACKGSDAANPLNADGDNDSSTNYGAACISQGDCTGGSECLLTGTSLGLRCTVTCNSSSSCAPFGETWGCRKMDGAFYCLPNLATDGDADSTESEAETNACTVDTLKCQDSTTVVRCAEDGKSWATYRVCPDGKTCEGGECKVGGCTPGEGQTCCSGQFRCRGTGEIQSCSTDGKEWKFYRECAAPKMCVDGECIDPLATDGDAAEAETTDNDTTTPGDSCTLDTGCISPNDYCFIAKTGTTKGNCTPFCGQNGVACPRGFRCNGESTCTPIPGYCKSNEECGLSQYCNFYTGASDGICQDQCFKYGYSCKTGYKCQDDASEINYGRCVPRNGTCVSCSVDTECTSGSYCERPGGVQGGCCVLMCPANPCGGGMSCVNGRCQVGSDLTDCAGGCTGGYVCDRQYGQCVLNCPPCSDGNKCDTTTGGKCVVDPNQCTPPLVCGWGLRSCCMGHSCSAIVYGVIGFCI